MVVSLLEHDVNVFKINSINYFSPSDFELLSKKYVVRHGGKAMMPTTVVIQPRNITTSLRNGELGIYGKRWLSLQSYGGRWKSDRWAAGLFSRRTNELRLW